MRYLAHREQLIDQARRLARSNQNLMTKIIKSFDLEPTADDPKKEQNADADKPEVVLRRGTSQPF